MPADIAVLAAAAVGAGLCGGVFGWLLWRSRWDTRLLIALLLFGMLALGSEAILLLLPTGPARLAIVTAAIGLPATAILVLAHLHQMPPGLLRIAAVSGLGPAARFSRVVLPLAAPGLAAGIAYAALAGLIDTLPVVSSPLAVLLAPALGVVLSAGVLLVPRRA